jgi:hypothetical protein
MEKSISFFGIALGKAISFFDIGLREVIPPDNTLRYLPMEGSRLTI